MKPLKQENLKELTEKCLDLLAKTSVEIGHKTDPQTLATLSKVFASDLIKEKRFGNMSFNQIVDAFHYGVRFGKDEPFLNIRTFYKWTYKMKEMCDNAYYEVHTLNNPKGKTLWYQEPLKLLKMKEEEIEYTCCGVEITQEIKETGLCPKCLEHI